MGLEELHESILLSFSFSAYKVHACLHASQFMSAYLLARYCYYICIKKSKKHFLLLQFFSFAFTLVARKMTAPASLLMAIQKAPIQFASLIMAERRPPKWGDHGYGCNIRSFENRRGFRPREEKLAVLTAFLTVCFVPSFFCFLECPHH